MAAATTRTTTNDSVVHNRGTKVFKAIIAMEIGTDDLVTGGNVIPICELPAEAIITSIKHLNDDLDTGDAIVVDIGIWKTKKSIDLDDVLANEAGAEVLDLDIYVNETTAFQAAVTTLTEILGSGTNGVDLNDRYKTVRVLAGVSIGEDPFKYFLGFKPQTSAGTPAAGGVYFEVEWVQG